MRDTSLDTKYFIRSVFDESIPLRMFVQVLRITMLDKKPIPEMGVSTGPRPQKHKMKKKTK